MGAMQRKTVVFVVRLWAEYLTAADSPWRGYVECAQTGQTAYFQQREEMLAFMAAQIPPPPEKEKTSCE